MIGPLTPADYAEFAPGRGRVYVYRNLRHQCWSIKALTGDRRRLVIAHMDALQLHAPIAFCVSEAGRQRVLRTGHKMVHAGIVGHLVQEMVVSQPGEGIAVIRYNPRQHEHFVNLGGERIISARAVLLHLQGVKAIGPVYHESCALTT